ncbi:guanylate cyclase-like protein, putative [Bodo saltans]|uniref:adenylate cyclase n=1 Tax=Bodo saltans TaxID=75058 RepID=A0A0S4IPK7_BODSA|nr:guanylate cyclase-like protein, putative [Bodo saltans]|eukprot:CUF86777.1 guanylate cyclase-like protein, putative [Bodo saltans]
MALRQQHGRVLASEQRKKDDATTIRKFFLEENEPEKIGAKPDEAAPQETIKFRFAFDPPEDLRHAGTVPDRLDPATRTSLIQRAEELAKRGATVTIKEATSQEQRRQKEEAAYSSFEELQAQHEEVYNAKLKMELDKQDSNFNKIHTLLFGPKPEDCSPFGDWDVYDRVQQHIRQFAYARPTSNDVEQNDTTQKLQERLNLSGEQIDVQRRRIRDLTVSLRSSAQEISSLKALLTEKQDELTQTKQKAALLQSQLRHMKDVGVVSVPRRQSSVARDTAPLSSGSSNEAHQELLEDFQMLVTANLQLEQENILLRARVAARGVDNEGLKIALQQTAASISATDLKERDRRRKLLDAIVPSSSAVIKLKTSREALMKRQERMSCDALFAHDADAAIELIKKPTYDSSRRPPPAAVKKAAPERSTRLDKKPADDRPPQEAVAPPAAHAKPADSADDSVHGHSNFAMPSPLWHSLQKHILGSVAISRADSLRREQAHTAKLRHRIAVLSAEVSELRCDRDASQCRADKMGSELKESKAMLDDVVARCESLSKALEDSHFSPANASQTTVGGSLSSTAATRRHRHIDASQNNAEADKARCKALEEKLSNFSEIMNERVANLELELSEAKASLNAAQLRQARSEGLSGISTIPSSGMDAPQSPRESTRFQQKRLQEEYGGMRLALSAVADADEDEVEEDEQLRSTMPTTLPDTPNISAKYEREISALSSELQERSRTLAIAQHRLGAAEDELASIKAEARLGVRQNVAHKVAPKLRAALRRARERLTTVPPSTSIDQKTQRHDAVDEDELAIERLLALVQPGSQAHSIVQRQLNHRRRLQNLLAPSTGGSKGSSGVVELRIQWLKLLASREQQLRLCRNPVMQQALIELLRETYEDALECEELCTVNKRNDAVLGRAAKHFVEWSSNRDRDDTAMEMRDIRSLEQLEREQLAWKELLQSQLQLARDIESKRSDIIANEATDVVHHEHRDQDATHGISFCYESTGVETVAAMAAHFGFVAPLGAIWSRPELQVAPTLIVPVSSVTTVNILKRVFTKMEFSIRYMMQAHDTYESVAARFGVSPPAVTLLPPSRCASIICNSEQAVAALVSDPTCVAVAKLTGDKLIDPNIMCKLLNIEESVLAEHNAVVPKGQRVYFPFYLHSSNAAGLNEYLHLRQVILIHQCTKHETGKSVAMKHNVAPDDVLGNVSDSAVVEVVLSSIEVLRPHVSSRWFETLIDAPLLTYVAVEGTRLLSEVAKASSVSRLQLRVPNLDMKSFIPPSPQPAEHIVRCRQLDQLKYAVDKKFALLAVSRGGSEEYIACDLDSVFAALQSAASIFAVVQLPTWDREEAARLLSAHVSDVHPWEVALHAAQIPRIGVAPKEAEVEHVVSFSTRLPQIGSISEEQLDDVIRNVQQDVVEIVAFACPLKMLLRCEVPFIDEAAGIAHVQIIVADSGNAVLVKQLLDKDGSVSELSHLKSALLDSGAWTGDKILLDIVEGCVVAPIGSAPLHHNVVGDDSLVTIALRYGVPIPSLISANAAVWLRALTAANGRKGRRRIQIGGGSEAPSNPAERPLRVFDIRVLKVPCGLPIASFTIKSLSVDHAMSLLQLSATCGAHSEHIFMDTEHVEWGTGTVLRIPPIAAVRSTATRRQVPISKQRQQHVVDGRGDTPEAVATRYHMTVEELIRENVSCVLLPQGFVTTVVEPAQLRSVFAIEHVPEPEDTIFTIAQKYHVAPQDILQWNPHLRLISDCDVVLAPLDPELHGAILAEQFPNVVTFVPDIPLSSIAKTFDCSVDDLSHLSAVIGTAVPGKKAVPLSSVGAVALAKRQRLEMYALVPLGTKSVAMAAELAECHISSILLNQRQLATATPLRVIISVDTAARLASDTDCVAENAHLALFAPPRTLVAARSVLLTSSEAVQAFHAKLQLQLQKQAGLAQRHHFLDDRLVDVAARLAMIYMNLRKITTMTDARHTAGEHTEGVSVNRESIGVQTDAEEVPVIAVEEVTRVRIPMHDRNSQTNLTGEAVEETLCNISEAQGKEILLETELQEMRSEKQRIESALQVATTSLTSAENQCKSLANQLQSFQLWKAATESATKNGTPPPPLPIPRNVVDTGVGTDAVLSESWGSGPASFMRSNSVTQPVGELSTAAKSFLANHKDVVPPSQPGAPKPQSQTIGIQVDPVRIPKRTQVTETDWTDARFAPPMTTQSTSIVSPSESSLMSNRRATLQRLVHVVEHSTRDNELAPKSSTTPMCIAFTDIQSSTALWARASDEMSDAVEQHHFLIRQILRVHSGYEVKTIGDSFMVAFQSPVDAMEFSLELQRQLYSNSWPREIDETYHDLAAEVSSTEPVLRPDPALWNGLRVRVGLNYGTCNARLDSVTGGYDYYGTLVNTAARVEGVGHGGQVLATEAMMVALNQANYRYDRVHTKCLGPQSLRGLDAPVVLYQFSPIEFAERGFGELRIDRANEMTEEQLAASVGSATMLQDAQLRIKKAEEAANAAAGELALERHRSQIALNAVNQRKESTQRRDFGPQRDNEKKQDPVRLQRDAEVWGSPVVNFSLGHAPQKCDASTMTTELPANEASTRRIVSASRGGSFVSAMRQEVEHQLQQFWQFAQDMILSSISEVVRRCSEHADASVVAHSTQTVQALSSSLQTAILQHHLQSDNPEAALSGDQLFAIREVLKHTSSERKSSTARDTQLPPISVAIPAGTGGEMRKSTVAKMKDEMMLEAEPITPAVKRNSVRSLSRSDRPEDGDYRSNQTEVRRANMQSSLIKSFLRRDPDRSPTPPFAPPVAPLAGSIFAGTVVSKAAEAQLERVRYKVEDEVLSLLRMDTIGEPPAPVNNAIRGLSQLGSTTEVEAVRLFREEQVAIKRERRALLAQRLGTRYRVKRLLRRLEDSGANELVASLWRRWSDGVAFRHSNLHTRERANILQLIASFSAPSIPNGTRGAPTEMEYVPWHVTRYEASTTMRRGIGAAPLEPLAPRSAPGSSKHNTSSNHFRLARFQ